jgi:hypothetical protein
VSNAEVQQNQDSARESAAGSFGILILAAGIVMAAAGVWVLRQRPR